MHKAHPITSDDVRKIAKLANLSVLPGEVDKLAGQFSETVDVVNELNEIDTTSVPETYQVTNLVNVFRDDVVDPARVLSQQQALSQAKNTHNGFFVVPAIFES